MKLPEHLSIDTGAEWWLGGLALATITATWLLPAPWPPLAPAMAAVIVMAAWRRRGRALRALAETVARQQQQLARHEARVTGLASTVPEAQTHLTTTMAQLESAGTGVISCVDTMTGQTQYLMEMVTQLLSRHDAACRDFRDTVLNGSQQVADAAAGAQVSLDRVSQTISHLMQRVNDSVARQDRMRDVTKQLQNQTHAIRQIAQTVGVIARQTGMLALNASIEAARSGQDGRGFAVVADEFRRLAAETSHAAGTISRMVGEVEHHLLDTVALMDETGTILAEHQQAAAISCDALQGVEAAMADIHGAIRVQIDIGRSFAAVQADLSQDLASMARQAEQTQMAVFGMFEHVQFSDICRQGLDKVRLLLDDVGDSWSLRVSPAPPDGAVPAPNLARAS